MSIADLRRAYHRSICEQIIRVNSGYPNFADGSNASSVSISRRIVNLLGCVPEGEAISGQTAGGRFEALTMEFLRSAFEMLAHLRPGKWSYSIKASISHYEQYEHLAYVDELLARDPQLASALGSDYIIHPDIVIARHLISDSEINLHQGIILNNENVARLTPLREQNRELGRPILHASVSCKWTIRSDRAQNTRTEALNLIRNRKGHLPHIVAVTAEPLPTRLAALCLGTGDLDCVYHLALPELRDALIEIENADQLDMLTMMIDGRRLRDISDLPFDLVI